ALAELADELKAAGDRPLMLFGSLDFHIMLIAKHRAQLEGQYVIPYPELETIEGAALKENFYALAEKLGIAHPRTAVYYPGSELESLVGSFDYPV
ncbi:carbamoyl-phosphate synthase, partial [Escherichia coli]|nr:carbamoyl-phosphate synthase [Escherichia coli]